MLYIKKDFVWRVLIAIFLAATLYLIQMVITDDAGSQNHNSGLSAQNPSIPFEGTAFLMQDGIIAIIIQNTSPGGYDCFIASGEVIVDGLNPEHVVEMRIVPNPVGGGMFVRVAASKPKDHLLSGEQMLRLKVKLSSEFEDARIDFIRINFKMFKIPITSQKIAIFDSTVKIALQHNSNIENAGSLDSSE